MRIAVIGAGAMGSIYGGHLSQHNEVLSPISPRLFVIHQKKSLLIW